MLTFEFDRENEKLEIHSDIEGLKSFRSLVGKLIQNSEKGKNDHAHLMTEDWGGSELSNVCQNSKAEFIHHVKLFCWNEKNPGI